MQAEADLFAHVFHRGVLWSDIAGDATKTFFASDLHQQFQKLRTKTFPLPRVADQDRKLRFVCSVFFDQTSDAENLVSAVAILVGNKRDFAVVIDETNPAEAFVHDPPFKAHKSKIA